MILTLGTANLNLIDSWLLVDLLILSVGPLPNGGSQIVHEHPLIPLLITLHKGYPLILPIGQIADEYFPDQRPNRVVLVADAIVEAVRELAHVNLLLTNYLVQFE